MNKNLILIGVIGLGLVIHPDVRAQQQTAPRNPSQSNTQQPQARPSTQQGTQRNQSQASSQSNSAMATDSFVKKVAEDNQMEVEISRMASSRAKSAQVKDYAQQLIKDHTNSGDTLKRYASKHSITLPAGSTASTSSTTSQPTASNRSNTTTQTPEALARTDDSNGKELESKSGADFDQAYIHMMVEDHRKAISLFEAQQKASGMDAEMKAFVNNTLPVLRRHLSRAEAIEKSVGSTTTESNTNRSNTSPSNANPSTTTPRTR